MAKLKKGVYYSTCSKKKYAKLTAELRAKAARMAKESDEQELAAYYAIQEIRKNRALSKLKQY